MNTVSTLAKLFSFLEMLTELRRVERMVLVNGTGRFENDTEHSYFLAMLVWYVIETEKLPLNTEKAVAYALAHDIVEAYAGDTYIYSTDKKYLESKESRETDALARLRKQFPEAHGLLEYAEGYRLRADEESRFVYALDKILPVMSIYLDGGRTWRSLSITWQMLFDHKKEKVSISPPVKKYFDELMELLKKEEGSLFDPEEKVFLPTLGQTDFIPIRYCPVINCVVAHGGKILLVRRSDRLNLYPGLWNGISGFLDDDKDIEDKVREELKEEIGLHNADIARIERGNILSVEAPDIKKTWIVHPVLVESKTDTIVLDFEADEYRWIDPKDLARYETVPGFDRVVSSFSFNTAHSDYEVR